ncbi:tryptophan synthase beta subunit-like PLP-dependent enzyme [Aspergillus filifer]
MTIKPNNSLLTRQQTQKKRTLREQVILTPAPPQDHNTESLNPTGSYKDRMALTGSSLAFICAVKGYNFHVVRSDVFAPEKIQTMRAFGAELDLVAAAKIESEPAMHYYTNQFANRKELVEQLPGGFDAFCGAAGSAGMVMGVAKKSTKVVVLEPASSPVITQGWTGTHGVEGISPGFRPPHLDDALCDEARAVDEEEGRAMCRRLAREEGVLVGTSTGLNVVAALQLAKELGPGKTVVTVACDTGLKYMNGSLLADS